MMGRLSDELLQAVLETIPVEFSVLDINDKVERILSEMKEGKRDKVRFWIGLPIGPKKDKHKILIEYYALRDTNGKYIGCLEATRDIPDIQKIEGEKRLLD